MSIDWFTFSAQILNFLILVWLLKRFLYRPVVDAMDAREARIEQRLDQAAAKLTEAEGLQAEYEQRRAALEGERDALIADARKSADAARAELVASARHEVDALRGEWREALEREQRTHARELSMRLAEGLCDLTREVLAALADSELETCVAKSFARRLRELDDETAGRLRSALERDVPVVETSFEANDEVRRLIAAALEAHTGEAQSVRFERRAALVCGVAVQAGTVRVEWSVNDYCDALARHLGPEGGAAGEAAPA